MIQRAQLTTMTLGMLQGMRLKDPINARLPVLSSKESAKNLVVA
jgi:hypothetical protein